MKNDAENQKKYPQNFFKRHSEHNPGNYITISTEIMKYRNSEGKPLPDEVIGYYFRLRTLQDGFQNREPEFNYIMDHFKIELFSHLYVRWLFYV